MEKWKKVIVRGKEKENFYCREDSKGKLEYRYRVHQQDSMGKMVDTWKKQDDKRQPFRTIKEAEAHRKAFIEEIMGRTERSMSVPDLYTLQEIFEDYVEKRGVTLAPSSLSKHRGDMKNHITPHFKRRRIGSITAGEIKNFITGLRSKQAYETSRSVLATMAKVWKYAYELGIIDRNIYIELFVDTTTKVTVPKLLKDKIAQTKQPEVYTMAQIERFCNYAKQEGTVYYILLLLCYYAGVRQSEALGLMWNDINWNTGKIVIHRQLAYHRLRHIDYIGPTKSKVDRIFQAPPALLAALLEWQEEQERYRVQLGKRYQDNEELENTIEGGTVKGGDFVLRCPNGVLLNRSEASHFRERAQRKLGDHFTFHGLRHTVVSRLSGSGVPLKNISHFIGHADSRTTEKYYLGIDELGEEKLMAAIASL